MKKRREFQKLRYESKVRKASVNYPNISFNDIPYLYVKVERDVLFFLTKKGFRIKREKDVFTLSHNMNYYLTGWYSSSALKHIFWNRLPDCKDYTELVTKCLEQLIMDFSIDIDNY